MVFVTVFRREKRKNSGFKEWFPWKEVVLMREKGKEWF